MRREELRTELLSLLYTEFLFRKKNIWFKARSLAEDMDYPSRVIGRVCSILQEEGLLIRYGSKNPSQWGTRFNTFDDPIK